MDWENLNADVNKILNVHYSSGRFGRSIEHVVIHYNAGNLTVEGCYSVWQNREASAHYQVEDDGRIGQLVWDRDTAWRAGNWNENCRSIDVGHANRSDGTVTEACLDAGAHLVAAICKYYGLGRPEWRKNVFPHWDFQSTSCPGELGRSQKDAYMARAQAWYDLMCGGAAAPSGGASSDDTGGESISTRDIDNLARRVINGEFGNGEARGAALGERYAEVQARVNEMLGSGSSSGSTSSADIDALARAVIRGDYGNGETRKQKLGNLYSVVQKRVNEMLS